MNEISRVIPQAPKLVLTATLANAVRATVPTKYSAPGDEAPFVVTAAYVPPQSVIDEARAIYDHALASLVSIERDQFRKWLRMLCATVQGAPQSTEDFNIKAGALGMMVSPYPARCFTEETLPEAMKTFKFFPSGKELDDFVAKLAKPMRDEVEAIRRIANYSYGSTEFEIPKHDENKRPEGGWPPEAIAYVRKLVAEVQAKGLRS